MKILPNGIAVLDGDTHLCKWIEESGRLDHDQNMLPVILEYIKEGDTVVDAGAFIGDHTCAYLQKVGKLGTVFAFEPNREAYDCLMHNCPSAICWNLALGDKVGYVKIVDNPNKGASFAVDSILEGVPVMTLDQFYFQKLDFLKLDIEGMEVKAIKGGKRTISESKPVILTEVNEGALNRNGSTGLELIELIESLGYKKKKVYDSDTLTGPQFDLLFIPC